MTLLQPRNMPKVSQPLGCGGGLPCKGSILFRSWVAAFLEDIE